MEATFEFVEETRTLILNVKEESFTIDLLPGILRVALERLPLEKAETIESIEINRG